MDGATLALNGRAELARKGRMLGIFSIAWGAVEATVAITAAVRSHSVSLAGFGCDSVIEVISAAAVMWRMASEMSDDSRRRAEKISLKIAGFCLIALSFYVLMESVTALVFRSEPEESWLGIAITATALIFMPVLAAAKKRIGVALHSDAMMTDAKHTDFCFYLAAIVLVGQSLHSLTGWSGVDSIAGLVLVPIIFRSGILALQGRGCCSCH